MAFQAPLSHLDLSALAIFLLDSKLEHFKTLKVLIVLDNWHIFFCYSLELILLELQNRMTQMNEGLASLELDRRVASYPDYEEKQLLALNGILWFAYYRFIFYFILLYV